MGKLRTSTEKKLRPVGNTSSRPRLGAPLGPAGTKRPLKASSKPCISAGPQASSRGATTSSKASKMARTSVHRSLSGSCSSPSNACSINCAAYNSRRSRASPAVRHNESQTACSSGGCRAVQGSANAQSSGSKPISKALARARNRLDCAPRPSPRGIRNRASKVSMRKRPAGDSPKMCRPSRICDSLRSHK